MAFINFQQNEIEIKLVYYGPALSGKTTNLHGLHGFIPSRLRGQLTTLDTDAERTLFFDYFPLKVGSIGAYRLKLHVYSVPGQAHYRATRNLVLRDADGVVFVADSQTQEMDNNLEALRDLEAVLRSYGVEPESFPTVFQFNKQDLATAESVETLNHRLNSRQSPFFGASAVQGSGIVDCFNTLVELVSERLREELKGAPNNSNRGVLRPRDGAQGEGSPLADLIGQIGELGEHDVSEVSKALQAVGQTDASIDTLQVKAEPSKFELMEVVPTAGGVCLVLESSGGAGEVERLELDFSKEQSRRLIDVLVTQPKMTALPEKRLGTALNRDLMLGIVLAWLGALTIYLMMA